MFPYSTYSSDRDCDQCTSPEILTTLKRDCFCLSPGETAVRDAYLANAVVLTPHPQAHALYADKRNLALLTSAEALDSLAVPQAVRQVLLAGISHTKVVDPGQADRLWAARKGLTLHV